MNRMSPAFRVNPWPGGATAAFASGAPWLPVATTALTIAAVIMVAENGEIALQRAKARCLARTAALAARSRSMGDSVPPGWLEARASQDQGPIGVRRTRTV